MRWNARAISRHRRSGQAVAPDGCIVATAKGRKALVFGKERVRELFGELIEGR
jgi:hypothetical protein